MMQDTGPPDENSKPVPCSPYECSCICESKPQSGVKRADRLRECDTKCWVRSSLSTPPHPATSAHRCTSETCRYISPRNSSSRNTCSSTMASSSRPHDHRYSELKRTVALPFQFPREM